MNRFSLLARLSVKSLLQRRLGRGQLLRTLTTCASRGAGDGRGVGIPIRVPVLGRTMQVWSVRELLDIMQHNYLSLDCYLGLRDIRTVVDAGAHVGLLSLLFKHVYPMATVHAFEPDPSNFELLSANLRGLPDVHVHESALGAVGMRTATFFRQQTQTGTLQQELRAADFTEIKVDVLDAAAVLERAGGRVDLFKIDIEGAEYVFLEGLDLAAAPARHLYIEFHSRGLEDFPRMKCFLDRAAPYYEVRFQHVTTYSELGLFIYEVLLSHRQAFASA